MDPVEEEEASTVAVAPKRRGRPKGAKDTKPRQKRTVAVVHKPPLASEEEAPPPSPSPELSLMERRRAVYASWFK